MIRILAISLFLFLVATPGSGQSGYPLRVVQTDAGQGIPKLDGLINIKKNFPTEVARQGALRQALFSLHDGGFITASIDSVRKEGKLMVAEIQVGREFRWAGIRPGNVEEYILQRTGFRDRLFYRKRLNIKEVRSLFERIVRHCENTGYPFASVKLDSVLIEGETVSAALNLNKNREFHIDSIQIVGDARIGQAYLNNYLSIRPAQPYNEEMIERIPVRIRELPFLTEKKPHQVVFGEKTTKLVMHLDHKKANDFNGVLGVLPDDETGEILITGDVRLKLQNALGRGEVIDLNWRKLQTRTQDLNVIATYPFLFNTPIGIDTRLKIYRRDTLFTDLHRDLGLQYLLPGGDFFKVFVDFQTSSLISTVGLEDTPVVPSILDVDVTTYGIGYRTERLDYRLNPRRGYRINLTTGAGNKRIKRNESLPQEMYDTLDLNTVRYQGIFNGDLFVPIGNRSTFNTGFQGGFLTNGQVFGNELYRIGGLRTLRGFDEESINASSYSILTLEYRYLLEQNSYLYAFWDGAWYENTAGSGPARDTPYGFGAGISFQTRAGIFSVNYALGRQLGNPILVRAAKIHFGFVNVF